MNRKVGLPDGQGSGMSAGSAITVAGNFVTGMEQNSRGRRAIEQVTVILFVRVADSAGIDPGGFFDIGSSRLEARPS